EKRYPTRWDLDEVEGERPVILTRICGHAAVLNSKALEEAGLLDEKLDSPHLWKGAGGEPTGIVAEKLLELVENKFPTSAALGDSLRHLQNGLLCCASKGVTTLGFVSCTLESYRALQVLRREGKLLARVRVYMAADALGALASLGVRGGYGDGMLKVAGIKAFADGSLGARTAWLSFPYADLPGESGGPLVGEEELARIVRSAEELDLQVATHGIGDRAIDLILGAYGRAEGTKRLRHRIEHCSIVRGDQIRRIKELGAAVTIQPRFAISDWWVTSRIGMERAKLAYPFKTLAGETDFVGIGTDCPVEPVDPWETVYAAATRGALEGVPLGVETPEQRLTLEETLDKYTRGSAGAMNEEGELGTLELGMYADFVVLETDPFSIGAERVRDLKVSETYVGGNRTFPP
ncbi:MAG: amidohydrolase, partial [Candidatus Brockarchaeota archaeon]|nr:amidohydrolase [Candidatus Brockarchaeota archaeon]